jgi:hypothetical protein
MFQTAERNAGVVTALREHPGNATSLAPVAYALLGNDTDFTEFAAAGYVGLNFAVVAGSATYDTRLDTIDRADLATLQDMGDVTLSATRALADADLTAAGHGGAATYFQVFEWVVIYPQPMAYGLAGLAPLGALAGLSLRRSLGGDPA